MTRTKLHNNHTTTTRHNVLSLSPLSLSGESDGLQQFAHHNNNKGTMSSTDRNPPLSSSTTTTLNAETRMFFHLPFIDRNGIPSIHVEEITRDERRCPLCFHNAVSSSTLSNQSIWTYLYVCARTVNNTFFYLPCIHTHTHMSYYSSPVSDIRFWVGNALLGKSW